MKNDKNIVYRGDLHVAIICSGIRHKGVAHRANKLLPPEQQLSELDVSKIIHARKSPTPEQSAAISDVLGRTTEELFG